MNEKQKPEDIDTVNEYNVNYIKWRPPSLSELTPY